MERYNIFQSEHRRLSTLLNETVLHIKEADVSILEKAEDVVQKMTQTIAFFTTYHQLEEQVIFLPLFDLEPSIVDNVKKEYRKVLLVAKIILETIRQFDISSEIQAKRNAVRNASSSFTEFAVACFQLMEKKESLLNKILWHYFSDKHLKDMHNALTGKTAIEQSGEINDWHLCHSNNHDVVSHPESTTEKAFQSLLAVAKRKLPEHQFNKIVQLLAAELELI